MHRHLLAAIVITAVLTFHLGLALGLALGGGGGGEGPPPTRVRCEGMPAVLSGPGGSASAELLPARPREVKWQDRVVDGDLLEHGDIALGMGLARAIDADVDKEISLITTHRDGTTVTRRVLVSGLMQVEDPMADQHCALITDAVAAELGIPVTRGGEF